jgi:predicted cupin superfamily sugar epimerase
VDGGGGRVTDLIERLGLVRHPEGGHYREVFRSDRRVDPGDGRPARSAVTCIHFLLEAGEHSRWHSVASDEIWIFEQGEPLDLFVAPPSLGAVNRVRLGPGHSLMHAVPAGWWQAARPAGSFSLCACAVGPGFEFDDFAFLSDNATALGRLSALDAELATLA